MLMISHRGNIDSVKLELENRTEYIQAAIDAGYDVEMDVWYDEEVEGFFLGHDGPQYKIDPKWLYERSQKLWVHTKNFAALSRLIDSNLRLFYHEKEKHTIISNCDVLWSDKISEANEKSIIPLISLEAIKGYDKKLVYGICSDFIGLFNKD